MTSPGVDVDLTEQSNEDDEHNSSWSEREKMKLKNMHVRMLNEQNNVSQLTAQIKQEVKILVLPIGP